MFFVAWIRFVVVLVGLDWVGVETHGVFGGEYPYQTSIHTDG